VKKSAALEAAATAGVPLKRLGRPEDVAQAIVCVDGGKMA
jgi:NAD(P)-dependent dehydrogenase (short-subunit alcohol dehydrogenase family)